MEQINKEVKPEKGPKIAGVSMRNLARGFAMSAIVTGYIVGPLLLFGGIAWWLNKAGYISRWIVIVAVLIAFFISNTLIIVRSKKMVQNFNKKVDKTTD